MALWVVDRLGDEPLDARRTAMSLFGGLLLLGLAGTTRIVTRRRRLHASAAVSTLPGGVFAIVLSLRGPSPATARSR